MQPTRAWLPEGGVCACTDWLLSFISVLVYVACRLQSTFPSSVLLENHAAAAKAEKGERYHGTVIGGAVYDVQAPDVPILDW